MVTPQVRGAICGVKFLSTVRCISGVPVTPHRGAIYFHVVIRISCIDDCFSCDLRTWSPPGEVPCCLRINQYYLLYKYTTTCILVSFFIG